MCQLTAEHGPLSLTRMQQLFNRRRAEMGCIVNWYAMKALVLDLAERGELSRVAVTRGRGAPYTRFARAAAAGGSSRQNA